LSRQNIDSVENCAKTPADFGDRKVPLQSAKTPVAIILDNLRSAFNTGNIFRIADAVRANQIIGCGYTPLPPHSKLAKTARGCENTLASIHIDNVRNAIKHCRKNDYTIYGVENGEHTKSVWDVTLNFPAAFVFGNEALGISEDGLQLCDQIISIPSLGFKYSINVANCVAVTLYESLRQWKYYEYNKSRNQKYEY